MPDDFRIEATLCNTSTRFDTAMPLYRWDGTLQLENDHTDDACGSCQVRVGLAAAEIQCADALLEAGTYALVVGG